MRFTIPILVILFLYGLSGCCGNSCKRHQYAEEIIVKVEDFKSNHGRLPENVSEIGFHEMEDSPAYYKKTSDSTYIVWYGLGVGESNTYRSESETWRKEG